MLNGINPKDFDWDDLNHQVRRAVMTKEEIETQDKPDEILRYQQKVQNLCVCIINGIMRG